MGVVGESGEGGERGGGGGERVCGRVGVEENGAEGELGGMGFVG